MKKILGVCLAVMMCFSICTTAMAADRSTNVQPKGLIGLSSGLPKVPGTTNQYNPWAGARAGLPEQISVGFTLYKVVNGQEIYVTSASKSDRAIYVEAEDFVNLSSGTYKLYAYYTGETQNDSNVTTYVI